MSCDTCINRNKGINNGNMLCNVTIIDNVCPEYKYDSTLNFINVIDLRKD